MWFELPARTEVWLLTLTIGTSLWCLGHGLLLIAPLQPRPRVPIFWIRENPFICRPVSQASHFLSSQEKQQKSQCAKKGFSVPSAPIYPLRPPCYWTRTHFWVLMKVGALLRGRGPCLQGVCLGVPWNQLSSLAISSPSALFTSG